MSLSPRPEQPMRIRAPGCACGVAPRAEKRMRTFDGRQNALVLGAFGERIQRLVVRRRFVGDASAFHQVGMLGADAGIIEAGGHRMRFAHLAEGVLQYQRIAALQDSGSAESQRGRVVAEARRRGRRPPRRSASPRRRPGRDGTSRWHSSRRPRRPPPTSGKPPAEFQHLRARLAADHRLQFAHQVGIRVRPHRRAQGSSTCRRDRTPNRAVPRRWRRARSHRRRSPAPPWRPAAACVRHWAPAARRRPRPCRPRRAVPSRAAAAALATPC